MTKPDDRFDKLTRIALGLDPASLAMRAAQAKLPGADLYERMQRDQRRIEEMLGQKPDYFAETARKAQAFSDMLAQRPAVFDEIAKRDAQLRNVLGAGGIAGLAINQGAAEQAAVTAQRLARALPTQAAYERLIDGRAIIPDHVVNALAQRASLNPVIEQLNGYQSQFTSRFAEQMDGISRMIAEAIGTLPSRADFSARFPQIVPPLRLPTTAEISGVDLFAASGLRVQDAAWGQATATQIASINVPWVRDDRPDLAIEGFAALKGLTEEVGSGASDGRVTRLVRAELGDYRRQAPTDDEIDDPLLVSGFRFARGFDERLASLPMALVASVFEPFGMLAELPPEADPDELDEAIVLIIRKLERKLRAFIDARMKAAVGEHWVRQRVHKNVREEWELRRQADADAGRPAGDLLDYADFAHYRIIIEQGDNWRDAFRDVFRAKTSVVETLARLSVIRNPVAHVRPLTVEDLLVLRVEGRRLYQWMGEPVP